LQNGDNITATYATTATAASPAGTYPIVPTLVDPTAKLGNYAITSNNGTLTVVAATLAAMITPTNGSTVLNPVTFTWTPGTNVTTTFLWIDITVGANDLLNFGGGAATSVTINNLPVGTIFVRLWSQIGAQLQFHDYSYKVAPSAGTAATMIAPINGCVIHNPVTFTWTPGTNVTTISLWIGTAAGKHDLVNFGAGTATSDTVASLPVGTIFVRLWSKIAGQLQFHDYTYTVQ
jgi:hypothetical protein